jgi:hypothetical protein
MHGGVPVQRRRGTFVFGEASQWRWQDGAQRERVARAEKIFEMEIDTTSDDLSKGCL